MQLFTNNANSRLFAGISNVSLSLQVAAGEGAKFPNPTGGDFFLATLSKVTGGIESDIEIVKVTARATDVFTIIRAQEGTAAQVYAESDWIQLRMTAASATSAEAHINSVANPHSVTKAQVGLGSVDNTTDVDKPVSTAQATAIGLKINTSAKDATGGVPGLTLFKLNMRNAANTITSWFTNTATVARTWTFPDKDGTVAMTSDFAAPGPIGGTTPAAGTFTALTSTGNSALGDSETVDTHAIKGATTLLANSASAALTVTQTGAGNAFVVEDSASTDSTPFVIDSAGNVGIGLTTISTAKALVATSTSSTSQNEYGVYAYNLASNTSGAVNKYGLYGIGYADTGYAGSGAVVGVFGQSKQNAAVNVSNSLFGMQSQVVSAFAGTIGAAVGLYITHSHSTAAVTDIYGIQIPAIAGSTTTNAYGVHINTITGATNNYGFYSNIASAANSYNFYAAGTAANYLAGPLYIGQNYYTSSAIALFYNSGTASAIAAYNDTAVSAATTSSYTGNGTFIGTAASSFTLATLNHFSANQSTLGAGSVVTNQRGFQSQAGLVGATNNFGFSAGNTAAVTAGKVAYGFHSAVNIATGGGTTWGFYAAGTAANYFGGNVTVGGGGTLGYGAGSGGTVTQASTRTTGVTLNKPSGDVTLVSAAGSATYQSLTVTNSAVEATDSISCSQKSGTDLYEIHTTNVAAGSFRITYRTTGGTTTEQPVFHFNVIKGAAS